MEEPNQKLLPAVAVVLLIKLQSTKQGKITQTEIIAQQLVLVGVILHLQVQVLAEVILHLQVLVEILHHLNLMVVQHLVQTGNLNLMRQGN